MIHKRWGRMAGVVTGITLLLLMAGSYRTGAQGSAALSPWDDPVLRGKIHPALLKRLVKGEAGPLPVVVEMNAQADLAQAERLSTSSRAAAGALAAEVLRSTAEASQRDVRAFLAAEESAGRAGDVHPLWIVNAIGVHAATRTIWQLAAHSQVALIREDRYLRWVDSNGEFQTSNLEFQFPFPDLRLSTSDVEWGIHQIRADEVWVALGITGTGVVVANTDTGVDWLHPALTSNYRGCLRGLCQHATSWYDATPNGAVYPVDGHGHGTHTMGTLAGQGGIGVAPGAQWIAARVLDSTGLGYDTWIHAGLQWILAPGGDPAMAPDLVSSSWGNDFGGDTTFQNDLRALRAAGILPVFSNGNKGPNAGTVGAPASLPEAFAVGATDDTDMVAIFSSRGPSPWGEIRPHVVAPGVGVRSAWPGGGYQLRDGTSMAAPHVAGVAALMLSARPDLTISATIYALTTTAVPLTTTIPNNESGWGRVDTFEAVMAVTNAGALSGTVRNAFTFAPIVGAWVSVSGAHTATMQTDASGDYFIGVATGIYNVSASAFGYQTGVAFNVVISSGVTATHDFALMPFPTSVVQGALTDATSSLPITATVGAMGAPVTQTAFGVYSLTLPVGTYTLRAAQLGFRVLTATVTITPGETITQNMALARSPKILLVDSGAWYSQSEIDYFQRAMDDLSYVYDTWPIRRAPYDTPTAGDLLSYDVVIWSSPQDSPGYVGANGAIISFLTGKHSLMVSGQDVAFWDGGGSGITYASYLDRYLKTLYVADDSGTRVLTGLNGDIMAGLTMTIAGPGGADNQYLPDEIAVSDPAYASQVLAYEGDGSGGQKVGLCLLYRGVVLSFGYEAITESSTRRQVIQRAMDYFASPRQAAGLSLLPNSETLIARPGDRVTYTLMLRNTSEVATDTITLTALDGVWPFMLNPTTTVVSSCRSITVTLAVTIPSSLGWNVSDVIRVVARSFLSPSVAVTSMLTTKTPAPVLLVDDARWYDQFDAYGQALTQAGIAYDVWYVNPAGSPNVPPASRLAWYPVVVWYTGYNWYDPVKAAGEQNLDSYLGNGGRLFLTSPFYLYDANSVFVVNRLGVMTFTDNLTTSVTYGAASSPVGSELGTFALNNPFPTAAFFTLAGAIVPGRDAMTALRGSSGRALAVHRVGANSRAVFMVIPFEALTGLDAVRVMRRVVGWLGWLGDSTLEVSRPVAMPGERITFTLSARHNGTAPVHATLTATLPPSVTLDPASLTPGVTFDPAAGMVTRKGTLDPGAAITASYQVTLDLGLLPGALLTTTAIFQDDTHGIPFDQVEVVRVTAPDLSLSTLVALAQVKSGAPLTYTLVVFNSGLGPAASAHAMLLLPLQPFGVNSSLTLSGSGSVTSAGGGISWQGRLGVGESVTLTYQMNVPKVLTDTSLLGETLLWDGAGGAWERSAWVDVEPHQVYLPVILK